MNIKQKTIQGVFWSAIQNWGSQATSLLVFFILARLLEPKDFGLVGQANIFITFMQMFVEQGFSQALIQREYLEAEHLDTAFWSQLFLGILLTALSFTTAEWVAIFFEEPQLILIFKCLSLLFFITSFKQVQVAVLKRKFAFQNMAVLTLSGMFIGGIVGVVLAIAGFGVWSLVSQQLVYEFVGVLILWNASEWRPKFNFSWSHCQELFNFGIPTLAFQFFNFFSARTDSLLIGYFIGEVALGYYSIASRILQIMTQLLVSTSSQVALSTFSRLQTDLSRFRKAFYKATQLTSIISFPTFAGVAILTPELVTLLFGKQWLPVIPIMQILAFTGIIRSISFFKGSVFIAMGKPSWRLRLEVFNATFNLIACLLGVKWGLIGVAFAYVISDYLVFPVGQWTVSKLIQTPLLIYLQQFIVPLGSTLVMAIVIFTVKYFLKDVINYQGLLVLCTVIGVIIYGLMIRFLAPELFKQILELLTLAYSRSKKQNI
jgi:O-antigen/teichoic acid export membrane protein